MLPTDPQPTLLAVHLGVPASTPKFVQAVQRIKTEHPPLYDARIQELAHIAQLAIDAWTSADLKTLQACCIQNNEVLRTLGGHAGIDIVPPQIDALNAELRGHHTIAKTTGAGGGDLAWIPCEDHEHASAIEEHLKDQWSVHRFSHARPLSELDVC